MEVLDLRKLLDLTKLEYNKLEPVCKLQEKLFMRETVEGFDYPFRDPKIINYYCYDIESKNMKKLNIGKVEIVLDFFQQKTVEGEDSLYYITVKKQIKINEYTLHRVNINSSEITTVFKFEMDKRLNDLLVEKIDEDKYLVFFKKEHEITIEELEDFDIPIENFGYEKAILYDVYSGNNFAVKDKDFLRGLRCVFFKTTLRNEECVVYEENYLEPYDKEQIYNDVLMSKKNQKKEFFHVDSIKYLSLKKFISEIESGCEKLSFVDIEVQGLDGYEFFSGVDKDNIYYEVNKFGSENSNNMILLNKESLERTSIILPLRQKKASNLNFYNYFWNLDDKYKVIFQTKLTSVSKLQVKEIKNGDFNYIYEKILGYPRACINSRYLITYNKSEVKKTSIIDMETSKIEMYKTDHAVFDDFVVLY